MRTPRFMHTGVGMKCVNRRTDARCDSYTGRLSAQIGRAHV